MRSLGRVFVSASLSLSVLAGLASLSTGPALAAPKDLKDRIPDFELVTLDGQTLSSKDLKGKVVLFDFWGTWCPPCVAALPALRDLGRKSETEPFVLIGIASDADVRTLRAFYSKGKPEWPEVWDEGMRFSGRCGVHGYPTYILINGEGEIVFREQGWSDEINMSLHSAVYREIRALKKKIKAAGG
jgi:thiol-disulfide isomerase/thioredoxin